MIRVFTLAKPSEEIKKHAQAIFNLAKGAYNLPTKNHSQQRLFDQLYTLGVRQVIHDGKSNEIHCMNGYDYAASAALGKEPDAVMIIKA